MIHDSFSTVRKDKLLMSSETLATLNLGTCLSFHINRALVFSLQERSPKNQWF